ncbi:MAG: hypothetical protein ACRC9Y_17660 [Aeromonas veronii]
MTEQSIAIAAVAQTRDSKKEKRVYDPIQDAKDLVPYVNEALVIREKMDILRGQMKDIKTAAKDALGIKPKQFNQVLNIRHARNRQVVEEQNEEILEIYDNAFPQN